MKRVDVVLTGFGNVGRAFAKLLTEKSDAIAKRYALALKLRAIFRSAGGFIPGSASAVSRVVSGELTPEREASLWDPGVKPARALRRGPGGVLVECASSDIGTGEPGLGLVRLAMARGWHVVIADKGPLVARFKDLRETAARKGLALGCSAAAGAALPALDVGLRSLAGTEITAVEGIMNGTTNYILTRMGQRVSFDQALREAQARGIAEPDPSRDVHGWDTAVKLLLVANAAMGLDLRLGDMKVEPITGVSDRAVRSARRRGHSLKLLGRISRHRGGYRAEVRVRAIGPSHPLFGVNGTDKGVTFATDAMGSVTVTGGKSDPRGAAAALLKDIINIYVR
jgi:homoserine dehydrogenase